MTSSPIECVVCLVDSFNVNISDRCGQCDCYCCPSCQYAWSKVGSGNCPQCRSTLWTRKFSKILIYKLLIFVINLLQICVFIYSLINDKDIHPRFIDLINAHSFLVLLVWLFLLIYIVHCYISLLTMINEWKTWRTYTEKRDRRRQLSANTVRIQSNAT